MSATKNNHIYHKYTKLDLIGEGIALKVDHKTKLNELNVSKISITNELDLKECNIIGLKEAPSKLRTRGGLLTHNGIDETVLQKGNTGDILVCNDEVFNGIEWKSLNDLQKEKIKFKTGELYDDNGRLYWKSYVEDELYIIGTPAKCCACAAAEITTNNNDDETCRNSDDPLSMGLFD